MPFFSQQFSLSHILSLTDFFLSSCRGMVDASGDQFVAYFLPSKDTIRKRKRDQEGETEYMEEEEWVLLHKVSISCISYSFNPFKSQYVIVNSPLWLLHTSFVTSNWFQIKKQFLPDTFLSALNIRVLRTF